MDKEGGEKETGGVGRRRKNLNFHAETTEAVATGDESRGFNEGVGTAEELCFSSVFFCLNEIDAWDLTIEKVSLAATTSTHAGGIAFFVLAVVVVVLTFDSERLYRVQT